MILIEGGKENGKTEIKRQPGGTSLYPTSNVDVFCDPNIENRQQDINHLFDKYTHNVVS
jgi:hypothetical protein